MTFRTILVSTGLLFALNANSDALAATCEQWSTNCNLKCAAQDDYGSCTQWTQECSQVCIKWQESTLPSGQTDQQKELQLQFHLREAAAKFPIGAKRLIWRSGSNGEFIIDQVIQ